MSKKVQIKFELPIEEWETLKKTASENNLSATEVIRQGIGMEVILIKAKNEGSKVLIKEKDATMKEVIF